MALSLPNIQLYKRRNCSVISTIRFVSSQPTSSSFPINNLIFKKWIKLIAKKVRTTRPRLPTTTTIRRYSRQQQLASSAFGKFTTDWRKINRYIGVSLIHFASKFIWLFPSFYYINFDWFIFLCRHPFAGLFWMTPNIFFLNELYPLPRL